MIQPQHARVFMVELRSLSCKCRDIGCTSRRDNTMRISIQNRNKSGITSGYLDAEWIAQYKSSQRLPKRLPKSLVGEEVKCLVELHGATDAATKLVQAKRRLAGACGIKGTVSIEDVVAQVLEGLAMQVVRARARDDGDLSTGCAAVLGGEQHRVDAELFDRRRRNSEPHEGLLRLVHDIGRVDAIISEVVVIEAAAREADATLVAASGIDRAGSQSSECGPVPSIQRKLLGLLLLDARTKGGRGLVKLRSHIGDLDVLRHTGNREYSIQRTCVADGFLYGFEISLLKSGCAVRNAVVPDRKLWQIVRPACRGLCLILLLCCKVCRRNSGPRNGSILTVPHLACQAC